MSYTHTELKIQTVLLHPRPLAREPGCLLLIPLLPSRPPPVFLPFEIWTRILFNVISGQDVDRLPVGERRKQTRIRWHLLFVCKSWLGVVKPLLYERIHVFTLSSLNKLLTLLHNAEQKWDSIRRMPYSTPGRWIHALDVSEVRSSVPTAAMVIDILLAKLFPLLPYLESLALCPDHALSRTALLNLGAKDGLEHLKSLKGLKVVHDEGDWGESANTLHPCLTILQQCRGLEQLEVINEGNLLDESLSLDLEASDAFAGLPTLELPNLAFLYLQSLSPTPIMAVLLRASLLSLRHMMITPYNEPFCPNVKALLTTHGADLSTLHINMPKHWPTILDPHFSTLLTTSPHLRQLSLDYPLPVLTLPAGTQHQLYMLTIPRPNTRFLTALEALLPQLPALAIIRARSVRWLRSGVSSKALEAGVQGEMRQWRRRLARRNVRLVDADFL